MDEKSEEKMDMDDEDNDVDENENESGIDEGSSDEEMDDDGEDEEEEGDQGSDEEDEDEDEVHEKAKAPAHNLKTGHDTNEGRTVFIRNLSYDSAEEDLEAMMSECIGPVVFAKLVWDKVMGHPRGTGFVKFKRKEDAEKCISLAEGGVVYFGEMQCNTVPHLF